MSFDAYGASENDSTNKSSVDFDASVEVLLCLAAQT